MILTSLIARTYLIALGDIALVNINNAAYINDIQIGYVYVALFIIAYVATTAPLSIISLGPKLVVTVLIKMRYDTHMKYKVKIIIQRYSKYMRKKI
jgi:hypothetical protein